MGLLKVLHFVTNHPLNKDQKFGAVLRFLKWQLKLRSGNTPILYNFTERAKLVIEKGMTGATGNLYCGLHEFNDMTFLLHFLRPGDTFADIGANVGSFTVLASAHVGASSFSFEPVPSTYRNLVRNIKANKIEEKTNPFNVALGSKQGSIQFTNTLDTMNHVAAEGDTETIQVPVETLDRIMSGRKTPILLKIDVEGFETEVISGASATLSDPQLKAIIIELPGAGARYGYDENKLHEKLIDMGFRSYQYHPMKRVLTPVDQFGTYNTLYLRDLPFIEDRIKTADKIHVFGKKI